MPQNKLFFQCRVNTAAGSLRGRKANRVDESIITPIFGIVTITNRGAMQTEKISRRGSKQKSVVLNAVRALCNHPTAEDVLFRAREEMENISFSTVYRNLGILVDEGDLITISGKGSEVHYDHVLKNHCHIQCRICGKVRDISFPAVDYKRIPESDASGFTVDGVCVTFTGTCRQCREKQDTKGAQR
jgi:Fe2+ or Zn2+ uptake regulation protein